MRALTTCCLLLTLPTAAIARETIATQPAEAATSASSAPMFLRIEPSFWGSYGIRLSRAGQEDMGPGFLTLNLAEVVRGSAEAETHARHAKVWASLNFGFALAAAGLLATSMITYADDHDGSLSGWPDFVPQRNDGSRAAVLNLGWLISLTASVVSRYMAYEEIMTSVNSYNFDVVQGRVR